MFLMTRDEVDAGCAARPDPGVTASPWAEGFRYDAVAGKALDGLAPATALDVVEGLKDVFDPEIPVNVYDLGLVLDVSVCPSAGDARLLITLTAPNCPAAGILPQEIAEAAAKVPGIGRVGVELTFDVSWNPDMMSEIAKVELGML